VHKWMKFGAVALAVAVAAGCSDSTEPTGEDISQAEKTALASALTQSGALAAIPYASFASVAVQLVGKVGSLQASTAASAALTSAVEEAMRLGIAGVAGTSYEGAVGFILDFDITSTELTESAYFVGIVGWNGVNTSTSSVDELVVAAVYGDGAAPNSVTGDIGTFTETKYAYGAYWDGASVFFGTDGMIAATGASFGGGTDCSASQGQFSYTCSYSAGSMNGNFEFMAEDDDSGTYTQAPVSFSGLPALKITISITE
jgi:hypothetical protein